MPHDDKVLLSRSKHIDMLVLYDELLERAWFSGERPELQRDV